MASSSSSSCVRWTRAPQAPHRSSAIDFLQAAQTSFEVFIEIFFAHIGEFLFSLDELEYLYPTNQTIVLETCKRAFPGVHVLERSGKILRT